MHRIHNYSGLIKDLRRDLLRGLLSARDEVFVYRDTSLYSDYNPIFVYFYPTSSPRMDDLDGLIVETMVVGEIMCEMITHNPLTGMEMTTAEVARKYGRSQAGVKDNCARGALRCRKSGNVWMVDTQSAANFYERRPDFAIYDGP